MCDFKSISQVYQHSSPFSVQGSITMTTCSDPSRGLSRTSHGRSTGLRSGERGGQVKHLTLLLTQPDLKWPVWPQDWLSCRRSGCCVWSVNSGIWKSRVSSHLSVHSRFGLNNSIGVKVQCVSQVSPLHEFFSFAWIQHRPSVSAAEHVVVVFYTNTT